MAKAISYIRFSTKKQIEGTSLERQQSMIDSWLLEHPEIELSDLSFSDLGRSGYHATHLKHQLGAMLDAISDGKIKAGDYILVEAIDRIGRLEMIDMLSLITNIVKSDVKIITLENGNEYSREVINTNPSMIYYLVGQIDLAHSYSKRLSYRVANAWKTKSENAKLGLGVNRKAPWFITRNEKTNKFDVITPEDKSLVLNIYEQYLAGISQDKIVKFLKANNSSRFQTYSSTALKKLLSNKTCIGYWGEIKGAYPAAVSEELFYSVQEEIVRRSKGRTRGSKSGHILAGIVKCGECGSNFSIKNYKHSSSVMRCSLANKDKTRCSNIKSIPTSVLDYFRISRQTHYIQKIKNSELSTINEDKLVIIDGRLSEIEKSLHALSEDMKTNGFSSFLSHRSRAFEKEKQELETKRAGVRAVTKNKLSFPELKNYGLLLSKDSIALNAMLIKSGFSISCQDNIIKNDNESIEYVRSYKDSYEIIESGNLTSIRKDLPTDEEIFHQISSPESIAKLKKFIKNNTSLDK